MQARAQEVARALPTILHPPPRAKVGGGGLKM